MSNDPFLLVSVTTPSPELAQQLAQALVEARLAACVQVQGPIHSTYRWEAAVEEAQEWLCTVKTSGQHWAAVETMVCDLHPYACPEIVAVPLVRGSAGYLAWLAEQLGSGAD